MAIDLKSVGIIAGSVGAVAGLSLLSKLVTRTRSASERGVHARSENPDDESDEEYEKRARRFGYPKGAALAQAEAFSMGEFARSYHGANLDPIFGWEGPPTTADDAIWAQQKAARMYEISRRRMGLK